MSVKEIDMSQSERVGTLNNIEKKQIKKRKLKIMFFIIIGAVIIIAGIVTITIVILQKKKPNNNSEEDIVETLSQLIDEENKPLEKKKIEGEPGFLFKTSIGQFNTIEVRQKYIETEVRNGKRLSKSFFRKDLYDIYVISENEPKGDLKYCYSKLYTCAISIVSECESHFDENCKPRTFLDLTGKSIPSESELRTLQEVNDIEDLPIPLCLFNITDNNGITSIKCPKAMNEGKIKGIILDLYFYRPPGIKRVDKEKNNITIDIIELEDGKQLINEKNGGNCGDNNYPSFCTTDMNTTKDSEGNLISYAEIATTIIKKNEANNYTKTKESSVMDITEKKNITLKAQLYKENMEKLLEKLNPYMKYYEQVTEEQFREIYELSVNGILPKEKKRNRRLKQERKGYSKEQIVFNYEEINGANMFITLFDDSSINTETMKANLYFKFGEDPEDELVNNRFNSILTKVLQKLFLLSKAGNYLADQLYQNIKFLMQKMRDEIPEKISALNNIIFHENLTKVFDSSLKLNELENLPKELINESKYLNENFYNLFQELSSGKTKKKFQVINDNIYSFLSESHSLIYDISDNLRELGNSLNSEGSKLTQISLYYLKKNNSLFMETVLKAEDIFKNYYINEATLINNNIITLIDDFQNYLLKYSGEEANFIKELYIKLEDKTFKFENIDDQYVNETIDNLKNSYLFINNITNKINDLINKELDLKGKYFITEEDRNANNISFMTSLSKAKENANISDNNNYIDKKYDETMGNFAKSFTDILLEISNEREELFNLKEEVLQWSLFKENSKDIITSKFSDFSKNAIKEIQNESDEYEKKVNKAITDFLNENEEELNSLISDLYILFSNETLKDLAYLYDNAYNNSNNYLINVMEKNEKLALDYLKDMRGVIENDSYALEKLQSYKSGSDDIPVNLHVWSDNHYDVFQYFKDTIKKKHITKSYKSKLNQYNVNIEQSKNYINNQLALDLINNYKNPIINLRKSLQSLKNNIKLGEKYPNYPKIGFESHKQIINILFNRLDNYLNDNIYNTKYKDYDTSSTIKKLDEISKEIQDQNNNILKQIEEEEIPGYDGDFCFQFYRLLCYLCTNKVWQYDDYTDNYCVSLPNYSNNHILLVKPSVNSEEEFIIFNNKFNEFYSSINEKIKIYNSKIDNLRLKLENIENEIMSKQIVFNYISEFKNDLKSILDKYYGDILITNAYEYYQNNIQTNMEKALNKSANKWDNLFDTLEQEIENNKNAFTSSLDEFGSMSLILYSIITQNISVQYFNSVIKEQKNEVNYTISYYYNYLINLANSTNNYIINRIISNQNQFNYIINQKKFIINDFFLNLMKNLTLLKEESLTMEKQISTLGVETTNFFKINKVLNNHTTYLEKSLLSKFIKINSIKNNIAKDQYSLSAKLYKENIDCAEKINNLYSSINKGTFVILDSEKKIFEEIILNNNWVFNFDELTNELDLKLYNLNQEIEEEFLILRKEFKEKIEQKLLNERFFTKDGIIEKIVEIYDEGLIKIDVQIKNNITKKINEMANYIIDYLNDESIRLEKNPESFGDNLIPINKTLENIKKEILDKINETIMILPHEFNINMEDKFYQKYIFLCLDKFVNQLKIGSNNEDYNYKLLNSTYNFGNIIDNILNEIKNEYNIITKKQLIYQHNKKIKEIYEIIALDEIKSLLDNKIDSKFNNDFLPVLKTNIVKDAGYKEYDINDEKQKEINEKLNEIIKDIQMILNSTKGNNYQIEIKNWEPANEFDFEGIEYQNIINIDIKEDFESFYNKKLYYEKNATNILLDEILKSNFNNSLNYLIPSFGKSFFDRILKYNENFKIIALYDNLRYSISTTIAFLTIICQTKAISAFPMDLKIRLYNLNNLAEIVEEKNTNILDIIDGKLDKFINEVQQFIVKEYSTRYDNELLIEQKYSQTILSMINSKLYNADTFIKKICRNTLEKYLKEPFIESYKNVMNIKSYEMIRFANEQKENLRQNIFNKFTINSEAVLNEINEKLNKTEESIGIYNNHFKTFKISNEIIQFLNDYGKNNVQPLYSSLISIINNAKNNDKISALNNLIIDSKEYEKKINVNEMIDLSEKITSYFRVNYLENITEQINIYDPDNYKEKLEIEKNNYEGRYIRRLEGNETEEDIQNRFNDKIRDNKLDDTFKKILESSDMLKDTIDSLKEFNDFDEKMKLYSTNLLDDYKTSEAIIKNKKERGIFDDEIYNTFEEKLLELRNITEDYYYQINKNYNELQDYLKKSIYSIYNSLNKCANATYIVFSEEYNKIKEDMIPNIIQKNNSKLECEKKDLNHTFNSSNNGLINYDIKIKSEENAFFSIDLELLNKEHYNPKLFAKIINLSRPKDMEITITSGTSTCHESQKNIDATFGFANYTMIIYYDTGLDKINITTISNIEDYRYTIKEFKILNEVPDEENELIINGVKIDTNLLNNTNCVFKPNPEGDDVIHVNFENNNIPSSYFIENFLEE